MSMFTSHTGQKISFLMVSLALDCRVMLALQNKVGSISFLHFFFSFLEQLEEELVILY